MTTHDNEQNDTLTSTRAAWDLAAQKYAPSVDRDIEFLRRGGISLLDREQQALSQLPVRGRAIHLQCSHGLDALSLLNLGFSEVVGVDISAAMLALARSKSNRLGWRAEWVRADVLEPPEELFGTAELVYTGKGAIPWVRNIEEWANVIRRLLRPGGYLYVFEGHPLDWVWEPHADSHRLHPLRSYFDDAPRPNEDFPAGAVERYGSPDAHGPIAWEYHWTLGEIASAVVQSGLELEMLDEHAEHYWPRFPNMPADETRRLPHTFSLRALRRTA
jgi:SAM-dependent methyltransferase